MVRADERIFYVTIGYQLVGLDAKTGRPLKDFGVDGVVDLKKDIDQELDPIEGEIAWNGAPIVARNVVLVGAAHRAGSVPRSFKNAKGYIRGFDARTGKRLWIFHTIPQPGEFGNDTWLEGSWEHTGNTGVWTQMAVDERTGHRLPAGRDSHRRLLRRPPAREQPLRREPGRRRSARRADASGTTSSSIIRSGITTSRARPILADITVNGRTIQAVAQPTKQGFLFVFDRRTGEPVWPIEERPVEQGTVPARVVLADPAVPDEAAAVRAPGISRGLRHRLHAGAQGRGARIALEVQDRPGLHPADRARRGGQGRPALHPERSQLAWRVVRSRHRACSMSTRTRCCACSRW